MTIIERRYVLAAALLLAGACESTGPAGEGEGALLVTTVTTGAEFDDQYRLDISQSGSGELGAPIGPNATYLVPLHAGRVNVSLYDVASNCTLSGVAARSLSVSAGDTASTMFQISCVAATAHVAVLASTAGADRDVDGYVVALDNMPRNVGIADSVVFPKVPPGTHGVALRAVAANCAASPDTAQTAALAAGDTLRIVWTVTCAPATDRRLLLTDFGDIYVRNPGATLPVNVTNNVANDVLPAWSPDGTAIAFVSNRSGDDEIYLMRPDGSGVTNLTNNPTGDSFPAWSADGTRIVFVSDRDGNSEIYLMNADGSGQTRLTSDPAPDTFPAWSPDGTRIAFLRACSPLCSPIADAYIMRPDGSGVTRLTTGAQANSNWPRWSPDGARIALKSIGDHLTVMDSDGSHLIQLRALDYNASPTWSPDGSRFAWADGGAIYLANRDGSGRTLLTPGFLPSWSPDGTRIAFLLGFPDGPYSGFTDAMLINPDGTGLVRVTYRLYLNWLAWSPK